ncbi:hypothetical protein HanIR_Chr11g0530001 [Helianthus annuus]|nr:hypothetical protein HanIR_Chr11g0530001 [Helianthus annuus]
MVEVPLISSVFGSITTSPLLIASPEVESLHETPFRRSSDFVRQLLNRDGEDCEIEIEDCS